MARPFLHLSLVCTLSATAVAQQGIAPQPDRTVLPMAPPPFTGNVGTTFADSTPAAEPRAHAPAGAPNVLLVLIDDAGFGQSGTFGGLIPTPTLDGLAANGLRYNRFHV